MKPEKVNILLVDDRPEGLVTLEAVLSQPHYNLVKAGSGNEALAQVLTHDFAVILMDVQMPGMDGFETASIIKQREKSRNIPIIFLTAINKADQFVATGYSVGAVDYLFKPFDSNILKSKVAVFADLFLKNRLLREQGDALRDAEQRERVRTLIELESEGRRRYQNLADAVPQIVFRAGKKGGIEYFNQFWHSFTGLTLSESIGRGWHSVVNAEDLAGIKSKWTECSRLQMGFEVECRFYQRSSQTYRWHLLRIIPEFNSLLDLICWIGTATDIHDQKVAQEELLQAKRVADVANEAKSRFLANMSHEIRTPLAAILGFSELIFDEDLDSQERGRAIGAIRRNGKQLSKIIDEILDLSKVEAGKLDVEVSDISVLDFVKEIEALMFLSARDKELDLEFSVSGKIPVRIQSNAMRLQQILVNVIGNAIKFTAKGKVRIAISLVTEPDGENKLCFSVKDSGPGLTQEQIKDLFQPFTQVDASMTRRHGGTGLGLALSRRLASALGGNIVVGESAPGEGCNFVITCATGSLQGVAFTDCLKSEQVSEAKSPESRKDLLRGYHILVVEDSLDNQAIVSHFLTRAGAEVEFANDGVEGVDRALHEDYNLVLMDIQMPKLDGYGAISQLRAKGYKKPIIALTAHAMVEERQLCLKVGANQHLTKPVNCNTLIDRVYELCAR